MSNDTQIAAHMKLVTNLVHVIAQNLPYSGAYDAVEASARQLAEQPGFVMVPVEPTPAMLVAMWDHRESMRGQSENRIARAGYTAMLAARPLTAAPIPEASVADEQTPASFYFKGGDKVLDFNTKDAP